MKVNRNPNSDNELVNKKYLDDELDKNTIVRFYQTLENYLKVSVGDDTYNLTKYNKIQMIDVTEIRYLNTGSNLLQKWKIQCSNKYDHSRVGDFLKSTKTNSPTGHSGATTLPPIGWCFMFIEVSTNNHGNNKCIVSFERRDIIQISNITFYYNRHSFMTDESKKGMGRFRIQLLLDDGNWSTRYTIEKDTQYHDSPSEWSLLNLDFTEDNYGIKLIMMRFIRLMLTCVLVISH